MLTDWQQRRLLREIDDRLLADVGLQRAGRRFVRHVETLVPTNGGAQIRDCVEADIPHIQRIYAHHVLHGAASFEEIPPSADELAARRAEVLQRGLPYLIADCDGVVVGYSYAAPYRTRSAYRYTIENSVYVADGLQRHGIGSALLGALIARRERGPWRQMIAVIGDAPMRPRSACTSGSASSIPVRCRRAAGKFNRRTDSVLMQRALNAGAAVPPA